MGGTHLKRGSTGVQPSRPLFLDCLFHKPPVEAQVHSQDPHLKEKCNICLQNLTISEKYYNLQFQRLNYLAMIFIKKLEDL